MPELLLLLLLLLAGVVFTFLPSLILLSFFVIIFYLWSFMFLLRSLRVSPLFLVILVVFLDEGAAC